MLSAASALLQNNDVDLAVSTISSKVNRLTKVIGNDIVYYIIPLGKGNDSINTDYCQYWQQIRTEFQPDLVHIHGTEYSHGYAYIQSCGNDNVVISIQGLTSVCAGYYRSGIALKDIFYNITLRDLLKGSIIYDQKSFAHRAKYEVAMIKGVNHIIGRTSWDFAHVKSYNPNVRYYFCNETLRPEFYLGDFWNYDTCVKHSIFLSQASYPIKGLQQVLKAMPYVLLHYPDAKVRIAGENILAADTLYDKLRLSGYAKYIKQLIKRYHLDSKISFIGNLNAEQMKKEYLQANVFICPSSVENSPNSLGEAQILGTPCISAYVGGTMDMMKGNEENLYRFEEVVMLADKICNIFESRDSQVDMKEIAMRRHNPDINSRRLYEIYLDIIGGAD